MREIRDKDEKTIMTLEDKKAWFRDVYVQYVKKITATSNLKSFLAHDTVKAFNDLGLVPPLLVEADELAAKIKAQQRHVGKTQQDVVTLQHQLQKLMKTAGQTPEQKAEIAQLNEQIITQRQVNMEAQTVLRELEGKKDQYVAFDEKNARHQAHFEAQFQQFMSRRPAASFVREHTSNAVHDLVESGTANVVGDESVHGTATTGEHQNQGYGT